MNIPVLDHGYIKLIESWGSDERIIESARMSTDGAFRGWGPKRLCSWCQAAEGDDNPCKVGGPHIYQDGFPGDEKLLRYLWENKHHTPFEMAGITVEIQAPIFIFRQWHRHRVPWSYNELSARYTSLPNLFYVPSIERIIESSKKSANKQASGGGFEMSATEAVEHRNGMLECNEKARTEYELEIKSGIAPELARCVLPVSQYSRMRASSNLRGILHFLGLRLDPHAQYEMRAYAEPLHEIVQTVFPRTWALFAEAYSK